MNIFTWMSEKAAQLTDGLSFNGHPGAQLTAQLAHRIPTNTSQTKSVNILQIHTEENKRRGDQHLLILCSVLTVTPSCFTGAGNMFLAVFSELALLRL